jgi:hypothetical protein
VTLGTLREVAEKLPVASSGEPLHAELISTVRDPNSMAGDFTDGK